MLSSRARYATRAVLELSLRYEEGPLQVQEIAEPQAIPVKFLQQILRQLKLDGFISTRKGPGGGYQLARAPKDITLGELVRAVDGPIAMISCVSVTRQAECGCPHPESCGLRHAFQEARDAMAEVLDRITFEDIRRDKKGTFSEL